jgi:hypothetical protein
MVASARVSPPAAQKRGEQAVIILELLLVTAIPAVGLFALWLAFDRWARKHDPMGPSRYDHLTPGSAGRRRSSFDD